MMNTVTSFDFSDPITQVEDLTPGMIFRFIGSNGKPSFFIVTDISGCVDLATGKQYNQANRNFLGTITVLPHGSHITFEVNT
jgi:hypothetical protein